MRGAQCRVVVLFNQQHEFDAHWRNINIGAYGGGAVGARPSAFFQPPDGRAHMRFDVLHIVERCLHEDRRALRHGGRLFDAGRSLWRLLGLRLCLLLRRGRLRRRLLSGAWRLLRHLRRNLGRGGRCVIGARAPGALVDLG